jgi:hypothetical protein
MAHVAEVVALVTAVTNLLAGAFGAWRWWVVEPSRAFWLLCRAGQALAVVQAAVAGVLAALGFDPADGLYWLYALLPVAVSFVAEQLRVTAAQAVLDARDRAALGRAGDRAPRDGRDGRVGGRPGLPRGTGLGHGLKDPARAWRS